MCPGVSVGAVGAGAAAEDDCEGGGAPYWAVAKGKKQIAKAREYMMFVRYLMPSKDQRTGP